MTKTEKKIFINISPEKLVFRIFKVIKALEVKNNSGRNKKKQTNYT